MALGASLLAEGAFPLWDSGLMGIVQVSFISQPIGGTDDYEIHFAPMPYFGFGIEYGK
jgi:hypothetical protein